jgi:hypothetical protein
MRKINYVLIPLLLISLCMLDNFYLPNLINQIVGILSGITAIICGLLLYSIKQNKNGTKI